MTFKQFWNNTRRKHSVVKIKVPYMKASNERFHAYYEHTFPKEAIHIIKVLEYTEKLFSITYLNSKSIKVNLYIPKDLEIKVCSKKEKVDMTKLYDQWVVSQLDLSLDRKFMIGSDPEIFVEDKDGKLIPAFNFLGDKHQNDVYWDGFQAEFRTKPSFCMAWHVDSIQLQLQKLLRKAIQYNKDAKLSTKTVFGITEDLLQNSKDEHVEFGCMPSLNVYGHEGLKASGRSLPYRSAGGHIHFGLGKLNKKDFQLIVKALDAIIGVACVSLFQNYDDPKRRKCYGLAGEYRLPEYGIEYRPLSNAWLFHPLITNLVLDVARRAVFIAERGYFKFWNATEEETVKCINTCDVKLAQKILNRNKNIMMQIFGQTYTYNAPQDNEFLFNAFINGMDSVVKDTTNFVENWKIDLTGNRSQWITHSDGKEKNVQHSMASLVKGKKVA